MTKRLPKEDQEKVAAELRYPFGRVELQCDQYKVSLHVKPFGERRQTIAVYVDGWIKGEWLLSDCEQRRRFMRRRERFLRSPKARADLLKAFGKREFKKQRFDRKWESYLPYWDSVTAMLRQFHATCASVELLAVGYATCSSDVRIEKLSSDAVEPKPEEADA